MSSDKGTENNKQLVATESPLGLKKICVPPRDTKTHNAQWEKWELIPHPNAGAPTSGG